MLLLEEAVQTPNTSVGLRTANRMQSSLPQIVRTEIDIMQTLNVETFWFHQNPPYFLLFLKLTCCTMYI